MEIKKLPRSREIAKESYELFKKHWRELLQVTAPMVVLSAANNFSTALLVSRGDTLAYVVAAIFIGIATIAVSYWTTVVLIKVLASVQSNGSTNIEQAKKNVWDILFPLLGLGIIIGALALIGTALFIIPGIIIAMTFFPAQYMLILEGKKIGECLKASREITRERKWNMFWTMLWAYVLVLVPIWILSIVIAWILRTMGSAFSNTASIGLAAAGEMMVITLFMPVIVGIGVRIYRELKK